MHSPPESAQGILSQSHRELGNNKMIEHAITLLGKEAFCHLKEQPKEVRNHALATLRAFGMSVRQIEGITGIGKGIISRTKCV